MKAVQLLGIPTEINSSHLTGTASAPEVIRQLMHNGMSNFCAENGLDLSDGNIFADRGNVEIQEKKSDFDLIKSDACKLFSEGPCIYIGGDHSVSWPIIAGLNQAQKQPHLIHIDAHPDLYENFDDNSYSHASPMARIMENNLAKSLTQIGIRTINKTQQAQIDKYQVKVFPANRALPSSDELPKGDIYFSIDLDGIDPAFAPGVSHHEPGGLSVRDVINLIWSAPGKVIGADIVEYNPVNDINEMTAAVAFKLIKELVARIHSDEARANC